MTTVLVQTPGTSISARAGRLLIGKGDETHEIPLGHVTELRVIGNARISTAVISDLAERGIPIHFQAHEDGVSHSLLNSPDGNLEALRTQLNAPEERRLAAARALVAAKVQNGAWVLTRLNHPNPGPVHSIDSAQDAEALRGVEGHAARLYFRALGTLLHDWAFTGRAYRPTPDPVNAALSFAYTLLLGRAKVAVSRAGLHPAMGTLHVTHGRRPALALDVMEPFRAPVCDLTVLGLLRSGQLKRAEFEQTDAGVRLGRAGCATVTGAITRRMQDWHIDQALRQQVHAVQRAWAGEECTCWRPPVRA